MRVFLDANILLAAANPQSHTRLLVDLLLAVEETTCITNVYAAEEARRNLARARPQFLPDLDALLTEIELSNRLVAKLEITLKPKDIPILYGAVANRSTHLLTRDEADFGELMRQKTPFHGVRVLTPKAMILELKKLGVVE
jgi:predicted nucleic acid-binding protein